MAEKNAANELDKKLSLLKENFLEDIKKIAEQRLKFEKICLSHGVELLPQTELVKKIGDVKPSYPISVRLEPSLGEKLAKSRGTSDKLEDDLHAARIVYEEKSRTIDRMRKEQLRKEDVLVQSVQQIEEYLRGIFYLNQEADVMLEELKEIATEQNIYLMKLKKEYEHYKNKKEAILNSVLTFHPARGFLKKNVSDLPNYSSYRDLVEYYLVLKTLQQDLLDQEAECNEAERCLKNERLQMAEFEKRVPLIIVSKESEILDLKSQLRNIKSETARLKEQIDFNILSKVKDDSAWYEIQRWIKKLFTAFVEVRPPGPEEPTEGTLNMLDRIKDFVKDGFEMIEGLK